MAGLQQDAATSPPRYGSENAIDPGHRGAAKAPPGRKARFKQTWPAAAAITGFVPGPPIGGAGPSFEGECSPPRTKRLLGLQPRGQYR
jgi:hypothetical protein